MTKTKKTLIIDGNNALYRAYFRFNNFSTFDGTPTGCLYGFCTITLGLINKFKPSRVIVVFDGKKSEYRKKVLPTYKQREPKLGFDIDAFNHQRQEIKKILSMWGVEVIHDINYEADDLIYALGVELPGNIILVSRDKDFKQCINKRVWLWDPMDNILFKPKNLKNRLGYKPTQVVDYLSLIGDKSDNIPGIRGVGDKTALKFLDKYGSIRNYLKGKEEKRFPHDKILPVYSTNRKLISLKFYYNRFIKNKVVLADLIKRPKVSIEKSKKLLLAYEIKLLLKPENVTILNKFNGIN